ncbi:hypothetical protein OH540_35440 [Streptomyces sp. BPPL-273]|uniref:hypothetical protein n=1 Tax=Streptomyces sp. BPPL-273 TaxID=2987533 RepID=UPI0024AE9EAE|nr:hypothetical protein [Streptomyces sp. BPPL-273]WHM35053.1 hypothetical protein OH540_35440 [Streptomyces sp. BPPL-273]
MTTPTQPAHGPAPTLRPFRQQPQRWERKQARARRDGHICCGAQCAKGCEPVLIRERTGWGWIDWTVPADGSLPQQPDQIAVFSPAATRAQRLGLRWLARRPAYRIRLGPLALRPATATVTVLALITATLATLHGGVPLNITVPAAALAPLLFEHLPDALDARAGENTRIIDAGPACRYLHRLAVLQTALTDAAARSDQYRVRRAQEVGHHQLFDMADLLQRSDTRSVSGVLITRERLMLQLVAQIAEILTATADDAPCACSCRPGREPAGRTGPSSRHQPSAETSTPSALTPPMKEELNMADHGPEQSTGGVYLLFAHEPYYPGPGSREINTSVVAADSLLHPHVRQPDGVRIHDLLTTGRQPGEIIPLATLTHELNGGADWPRVADWEGVTLDLLELVHTGRCDALRLGLSELARALLCTGPHGLVRVFDTTTDDVVTYGSAERTAALDDVGVLLAAVTTEQPFWPGDSLLPALGRLAGGR